VFVVVDSLEVNVLISHVMASLQTIPMSVTREVSVLDQINASTAILLPTETIVTSLHAMENSLMNLQCVLEEVLVLHQTYALVVQLATLDQCVNTQFALVRLQMTQQSARLEEHVLLLILVQHVLQDTEVPNVNLQLVVDSQAIIQTSVQNMEVVMHQRIVLAQLDMVVQCVNTLFATLSSQMTRLSVQLVELVLLQTHVHVLDHSLEQVVNY